MRLDLEAGFVLGIFRRVGEEVNGLELLDADLGVNGGGFEVLVAEELLVVLDVSAAFEDVDGTVLAHQMTTYGADFFGVAGDLGQRTNGRREL